MIIKNISSTVIGIGAGRMVMPEEELVVTKVEANYPAVRALEKMNLLRVEAGGEDRPAKKTPAKPKAKKAEAPAESPVEAAEQATAEV